jgi:diguanylate cyclase (GGDEF)-like protein/putative nucleotidyltransferase with HDIG domain
MSWKAKSYISLIVLGGLSTLVEIPSYWESADTLRFVVFTVLAMLASAWKISLPGVRGTMSANFLFVLIGVVQLSASETLVMALAATIFQYLYRAKARGADKLYQFAFNISSVAIAVRATTVAYAILLPTFPQLEFPFRLALTAIAYFVLNTVPVSIIISLTEGKSLMDTWRTTFFWSFPYYLLGAAIAGLLWSVTLVAGWQTAILVVPIVYLIYRSYGLYLGRLETEKHQVEIERNHAEEMASLHLRTIEALALAIEAKDQTTHDHLQRVQVYCTEVGKELGLVDEELQALLAASILHDIGKLAVPEHIISKPGKLTQEEFEKMKIHPVVGAEILERVKFPYPVVPIVRHHHEKWDGSGYPDGLTGRQIPIGARILSAVDCFDALSSDRQYRPALPVDEAMLYVANQAGKAFDPQVVDVLKSRYRELEEKVRHISTPERARLNTDIKVERGDAPDAGFIAEDGAELQTDKFVVSIAAAREEAQFLFSISQDLTVSIDPETMFKKLSERLRAVMPFDTIAYYHAEHENLEPIFVAGTERELFSRLRIPIGHGLSGWVVQEKKTICNGNPAVEPGFLNDRRMVTNMRSALAVPVEGASGVIGSLTLYSAARDAYTRDHLRILMAVAARLAFQVENSLRFQKARGESFTDELTELPNSRYLLSRLQQEVERAASHQSPLAVLVMDLDGFKSLNDTFGHLEGNRALRYIADHGRRALPQNAVLARMGGDEFVALLPGCSAEAAASLAAELQGITESAGVEITGKPILSASWGVSFFGADGDTSEKLLGEADHRMYDYKRTKADRMAERLARLAAGVSTANSTPAPQTAQRA